MRKPILILMIFNLMNHVFSQDLESNRTNHYIGLSTSVAQGSGLTYRFEPNRFSFQLSALPIFLGNGDSYLSLGFTTFYKLNSTRRFDLLSYVSNSYNFANLTPSIYIDEFGNEYEYFDFYSNMLFQLVGYRPGYNASLGMGGNFHWIVDKLILSVQVGYAATRIETGLPLTQMNFGIGLFFKF